MSAISAVSGFPLWLQQALTGMGLVGLLVLAMVYARGFAAKSTIELLRDQNSALEEENERLKESMREAVRSAQQFEQQNLLLRELTSGAQLLTQLQKGLLQLEAEARKEHQALFDMMRKSARRPQTSTRKPKRARA